jgi:hypothetical protein
MVSTVFGAIITPGALQRSFPRRLSSEKLNDGAPIR